MICFFCQPPDKSANSPPNSSIALGVLQNTAIRQPTEMEQAETRIVAALNNTTDGGSGTRVSRPGRLNPRNHLSRGSALISPVGVRTTAPTTTDSSTTTATAQKSKSKSVFDLLPDYPHSLYSNHKKEKKVIQNTYLSHSVDKILELALSLNLDILPEVISRLRKHGGHYIQFASICDSGSRASRLFNESHAESIEEYHAQNLSQGPTYMSGAGSARFGGRVGPRAANLMEGIIRHLYVFCAIIGDYESMLIMLETPPKHCPPMDPVTIRQYIRHKMSPPGTPMFADFDVEKVPLRDVFGKHIHAQGGCQSLDNMKHNFSPLTILHQSHGLVGPFDKFCHECRQQLLKYTAEKADGVIPKCTHHTIYGCGSASSRFFSTGNPCHSPDIRLAKADMRNFAKKSGIIPKQRDAFIPPEMLSIHKLVEAKKFEKLDFTYFLMLIQSFTLANRGCGLVNSNMGEFNRHLWAMRQSELLGIQSLPKEVWEKGELKPTLYNVEWKDNFPKLCYMRHLLVYIHVHRYEANIDQPNPDGYDVDPESGSPMHPPHEFNDEKLFTIPLAARLTQKIAENPITFSTNDSAEYTSLKKKRLEKRLLDIEEATKGYYTKWLKEIFFASHDPLPGIKEISIGSHVGRHTYYMFGVLGGGDPDRVKEAARHNSQNVSEKYRGDACHYRELMVRESKLRKALAIYPFTTNLCKGSKSTLQRVYNLIGSPRLSNSHNIQDIARYFVEDMLRVSSTDPNYRNAHFLLQKSYLRRFTKESQSTLEQKLLAISMTAAQRLDIFKCIDQDYEASGVAPRYKYNHIHEMPANVSIITKTDVLDSASMGDLISSNPNQPVDQFLFLEPHRFLKSEKIYYRLKAEENIRKDFFKLKGQHLVYATYRLYHESASLTVHSHNLDFNGWSFNTCSDFDLGKDIEPKLGFLRFHRQHRCQLIYFATCLFNCHDGDADKFFVAHPSWEFGKNKIEQKPLCPCTAKKCAAVWTTPPPSTKKAKSKKKKKTNMPVP